MSKIVLNAAVARKVLKVVDAGLVKGMGRAVPGKMCVEAAVCYAIGLPHGDDPKCVGSAVRAFKIRLNDSYWSSDKARAKGMRRLAVAQLGSDGIDQKQFSTIMAIETVRRILPLVIEDKFLAERCKSAKTLDEAKSAAAAADAAAYATAAAYAAAAADAAAYAAADAAYAADAAAAYAADAAAYAADAAAYATDAARDKILSLSAEIAVQALRKCKAPGIKWLKLC